MLYVCPKGWHNVEVLSRQGTNSVEAIRKAAKEPGYILEVHFWTGDHIPFDQFDWTGSHIAFDQVDVPKNVEVKKER